MVPLPPAEPTEFNAFGTIVRLSLSQNQTDPPNDTHTYTTSNNPIIPNNGIDNTLTTNISQPNDQCNFTNKVSSDITKITHAYNASQENTEKIIENAISQALTKAQSIITTANLMDTRNVGHQLGQHTNITCHNSQKAIHMKYTDPMKITYLYKIIQTKATIPQSNLLRFQSISY